MTTDTLLVGKDSKPLLLHLVNAVLQPQIPIHSFHVQNPAIPKDFADEKG